MCAFSFWMSARYCFWRILEIIWGSGWCFFLQGRFPSALGDSSSGQINLIPSETGTRFKSELQLLGGLVRFYSDLTPFQSLPESAEPLLPGVPGIQMFIPFSLCDWRELCSPLSFSCVVFIFRTGSWPRGKKCPKFWNYLSWFLPLLF